MLGALARAATLGLASTGPGPSWQIRARAAALRVVLGALLRRRHLPNLLEALDGSAAGGGPAGDPALPRRVLDLLRRWPVSCLWRALTGWAALRDAGAPVRFVIGVRAAGGDLVAHAWLEQDGVPLGEAEDPRACFTVAFVFPRPPTGSLEERRMAEPTSHPDVILTELQDGTGVLLHLGTKFYYALNRTGVVVWKQLEQGVREPDALAREIVRRFDGVAEARARADVGALLEALRAERLLAGEG
ncbi:lasso peptide biosynthesis B2 protein [Anaeromyxobacter oryzae]|uniref:Microcin J25-processing protein McjB C-terminal domain-containing protein n=1 Tax=Anaeromyxobacter oryzae TaxID=2918170 RepID=A0ABN6MXS5_9BACT|nr:lasso peptide biosynthesis B2 protein [Anaeromyxobacter oryzae]BDG05661.1 hypothetical protein AMOR_46570 [Anaeromyxobacter oryzae]